MSRIEVPYAQLITPQNCPKMVEHEARMKAKFVKIEVKLKLERVSKNVQKKGPLDTANPP